MTETGIKTAHKNGEVYITWFDDEGSHAHARLDPEAAMKHAQQVMTHADLAAAQVKKTDTE